MKKTLKQLWNEKKMALKYGRLEHALELNKLILESISKEKRKC